MADATPTVRQRLDAALVERRLAETRARAQALIMGGGVSVDGTVRTKPSFLVGPEAAIELAGAPQPYVSRGGLKLAHALDRFDVRVLGVVALDVGASTGGFTDVLLGRGVKRIYAIDVGYGQLAWTLRNDPRVVVMERTNIRHVDSLPEPVDLAVVDVSFISLRLVLPVVKRLLGSEGEAVALIKPQFEAGRKQVGRKGVVRDPSVWCSVLSEVLSFARDDGWALLGLERSPIHGPAGNVEFLTHLSLAPGAHALDIGTAVNQVLAGESSRGEGIGTE